MNSIKHEFLIEAKPELVCEAVTSGTHIKNWWTTSAELNPEVGSIGTFIWSSYGWKVKIKLEKIEGSSVVRWKCLESNMQDTNAWVGTEMNFNLVDLGSKTKLLFSHDGYHDSPCKEVCTDGWKFVLGTSLKNYLERGTGKPFAS